LSSWRTARKYSVPPGIFDASVRRILHRDLVVVQELSDRDISNRSAVAEHFIGILSDNVIILMTDEAHFHLFCSVNK
jgi:hypothetical protein